MQDPWERDGNRIHGEAPMVSSQLKAKVCLCLFASLLGFSSGLLFKRVEGSGTTEQQRSTGS